MNLVIQNSLLPTAYRLLPSNTEALAAKVA